MVDIQSATAEIRRGKEEERSKDRRNHRMKIWATIKSKRKTEDMKEGEKRGGKRKKEIVPCGLKFWVGHCHGSCGDVA